MSFVTHVRCRVAILGLNRLSRSYTSKLFDRAIVLSPCVRHAFLTGIGPTVTLAGHYAFPFGIPELLCAMAASTLNCKQDSRRRCKASPRIALAGLRLPGWVASTLPMDSWSCNRYDRTGCRSAAAHPAGPKSIKIYLDGSLLGGPDQLGTIATRSVSSMRYYTGLEASERWGLDDGQGAIVVTTRRD